MRSTTEKQWRDPKWWNENAGSASYYCPVNAQFYDSKLHPCCIPRPTQWKGPQDGLPPVGTECEYYKNDEWRKGVIFGHRKHRNGAVDVFIDFGSEWDYTSDLPRFRPIQSERDKAIEAMHADFDMISCNTGHVKVSDLYDAGYRKPMSREDAEKILCSIAKDLKNGDLRFSVRQIILNELGYKD